MRFEWQGWGDDDGEDVGRRFTATEAERALGIPAPRIRKWAQRRARTGLESVGLNWRREPLYREADLRALSQGLRVRDAAGTRSPDVHL